MKKKKLKKKLRKKKFTKAQLEKQQIDLDYEKVEIISEGNRDQIRRKLFVNEYIIDFNGSRAAIAAGYSKKAAKQIAHRLLTQADLVQAIKKRVDHRIAKLQLDQNYVVQGLIEVYERCMQATEVKNADGVPTGEWKFDAKGANTALKALGEHLQMFPRNVKHSNDPDNPMPVAAANVTFYLPNNGRPATKD